MRVIGKILTHVAVYTERYLRGGTFGGSIVASCDGVALAPATPLQSMLPTPRT